MPAKDLIPPPGLPVRAFNAPGHIEAVHHERVDITDSNYTKLARGTLYSTVQGADQKVVDQFPGLYLLREIIEPRLFPWAHRLWGLGEPFTTQTIGQPNLTPAKYRRLVRTIETNQPVGADYTFPFGLSGDQTEVQLAQETIEEARLQIIQEIINIGADPLVGGETNEFGSLVIYESVVNEGSPIDTGYLVLKSTVTPFGNGKAVKITVNYPLNLAMLHVLKHSIGQDNLIPAKYRRLVRHDEDDTMVDLATYVFPNFLAGDQTEIRSIQETISRARQTIISEVINTGADPLVGQETDEWGIDSIVESIVNDGTPADQGFLVKSSKVDPLGNGKSIKITVNYPSDIGSQIRTSSLWDAEMRIEYNETRQLVPAGTPEDIIDSSVSEVRAIDKFHSTKINAVKAPTAVNEATAIVSSKRGPFEFPGFVAPYFSPNGSPVYLHRKAHAILTDILIKTWWVVSPTKPVIAIDDIISDSVQALDTPFTGSTESVRVDNVLHNAIPRFDLGVIFPATKPSYDEYFFGRVPVSLSGTITVTNGSPLVTGVGSLFTTEVAVGDLFFGMIPIDIITDDTDMTLHSNWPFASQTFAAGAAYVQHFNGSTWIGTLRVIGGSVSPARERNLWKVEQESVTMR